MNNCEWIKRVKKEKLYNYYKQNQIQTQTTANEHTTHREMNKIKKWTVANKVETKWKRYN